MEEERRENAAEQTGQGGFQMPMVVPSIRNVSDKPKKKRHAGLIISLACALVIVIGLIVAAIVTNGFRAPEHGRKPFDEINNAFDVTFPDGHSNYTLTISGSDTTGNMETYVSCDMYDGAAYRDRLYLLMAGDLGEKLEIVRYQGKIIFSLNGYAVRVKPEAIDAVGVNQYAPLTNYQVDAASIDTEAYLERILDPEIFSECAELFDFDVLDTQTQKLIEKLNDEDWVKDELHYFCEEEDGRTTYTFALKKDSFQAILEFIKPAFRDENDYNYLRRELEETTMTMEICLEDGAFSKVSIDYRQDNDDYFRDVSVSITDFGTTEPDETVLKELADNAQNG